MADPTTQQRMVLEFTTFYERTSAPQVWTLKFALTPPAMPSMEVATNIALTMAGPVLGLTHSSYLSGYRSYPAGSTINEYTATYGSTEHPSNGSNVNTASNTQQLEVCMLVIAPVGKSSKGRPVYLMKHIHDVWGNPGTAGQAQGTIAQSTVYQPWNGPVVEGGPQVCDPRTGTVPSAPFTHHNALYTRQMRPGEKRTTAG